MHGKWSKTASPPRSPAPKAKPLPNRAWNDSLARMNTARNRPKGWRRDEGVITNYAAYPMKLTKLSVCLLFATLLCGTGCLGYRRPNPLEGWKGGQSAFVGCPFDKTICDDYRRHIESLPPAHRNSVDDFSVHFFEDGKGQRAVQITFRTNSRRQTHVLIYDADYKRIKVIKYTSSWFVS
jgi:hypothetical protein